MESSFRLAALPLIDALEAAGLDTTDFGEFGWAMGSTFDCARATPIILDWLSRIADPRVKGAMVMSLFRQKAAQGEGARRLIAEFHRPDYETDGSLRCSIGSTLATIAGPSDADAIIEILRERRHGTARQMFCDALLRTRDPRQVAVLIELIDDDDVAGHAIAALRQGTSRRQVPEPELVKPKLQALLGRPSASGFAKRQARSALKAIARPS